MYSKSPIIPQHNKAIEIYFVLADISERDAIPVNVRHEGRECITIDTGNKYRLVGGITNADWVMVSGGGGGIVPEDEDFLIDATMVSNGYIDLSHNANLTKQQISVYYDGDINRLGVDYTMPNPDRVNFIYPLVLGRWINVKYSS